MVSIPYMAVVTVTIATINMVRGYIGKRNRLTILQHQQFNRYPKIVVLKYCRRLPSATNYAATKQNFEGVLYRWEIKYFNKSDLIDDRNIKKVLVNIVHDHETISLSRTSEFKRNTETAVSVDIQSQGVIHCQTRKRHTKIDTATIKVTKKGHIIINSKQKPSCELCKDTGHVYAS